VNGYLNGRYRCSFRSAARLGIVVLPLFWKRRWHAAMLVRGLRKPPGRPRVLDVGFGDASFLRTMRAGGWDTAGIEINEAAVAAARSSGLDVALCAVEEAPFEAESFDAITLNHVIEHLHDPVGSLRACFRLLRRNGVLWLATPNIDSPGSRRFERSWFGLDPPRHLVLFDIRSLDHVLSKAGFVEVRHRRAHRAELVFAGSEALATGRDATSARSPVSPKLRRIARVFDLAVALHPAFGEELVAVARKSC
jgi:SAM-dependent methyltransferase